MALNWNFKTDKMGVINYEEGKQLDIYNGNAMAIFLYEYKEDGEDMYQLHCFFADKEHARRCLGLTKDTKGQSCFPDSLHWGKKVCNMTSIVLNPNARGSRDLAALLLKAYDNITIQLSTEV